MSDTTTQPRVELFGDLIKLTHGGETMYLDGAAARAIAVSLFAFVGVSAANFAPEGAEAAMARLDDEITTAGAEWIPILEKLATTE